MPREWDTPHRECWNSPIHHILKAIDNHTRLHLATGVVWHEEKAKALRGYVAELKEWIHSVEAEDTLQKVEASLEYRDTPQENGS